MAITAPAGRSRKCEMASPERVMISENTKDSVILAHSLFAKSAEAAEGADKSASESIIPTDLISTTTESDIKTKIM